MDTSNTSQMVVGADDDDGLAVGKKLGLTVGKKFGADDGMNDGRSDGILDGCAIANVVVVGSPVVP